MEMDTLFLILGPHHLFFLFVILVFQNMSRPTPSTYPNPTRKYHISFLLSSRHEASATVQTSKSKLLFHVKFCKAILIEKKNLIDYIDTSFFFFFLGDILIEFNTCNHALINTWFTKKKKEKKKGALIKTLLSNIIRKLKIHIIKTLLSNLIKILKFRIFKHLLKFYYLIWLEN